MSQQLSRTDRAEALVQRAREAAVAEYWHHHGIAEGVRAGAEAALRVVLNGMDCLTNNEAITLIVDMKDVLGSHAGK